MNRGTGDKQEEALSWNVIAKVVEASLHATNLVDPGTVVVRPERQFRGAHDFHFETKLRWPSVSPGQLRQGSVNRGHSSAGAKYPGAELMRASK